MNMTEQSTPKPRFVAEEEKLSRKKHHSSDEKRPPRLFKKSLRDQFRSSDVAVSVSFCEKADMSELYDVSLDTSYLDQVFEFYDKIGEGSFGEVYKVRCRDDNTFYAVKRSKERFRSMVDRRNKLEEVRKHEMIPVHPNILRFYRAWEQRDHIYLQFELCEMTLEEYSVQHHHIEEDILWNILLDVLLAIKTLHDRNLIHLDIKLANILISSSGSCKLGDFGLVIDLKQNNVVDAMEGDPKYLAPELMQGIFTKSADIFSIGIAILELAFDLELPSSGRPWHELRRGHIPSFDYRSISSELKNVINLMMQPDFTKRPTVDELLKVHKLKNLAYARKFGVFFGALKDRLSFLGYLKYIPLSIINLPYFVYNYGKAVIYNLISRNTIPMIEAEPVVSPPTPQSTFQTSTPCNQHIKPLSSSSIMYLKELELDLLDSSGNSDLEESEKTGPTTSTPDIRSKRNVSRVHHRQGRVGTPRNLMRDYPDL